jgi:hypothetical protein
MNFLVNKNRFFGPNHTILMNSIGKVANFPRLWEVNTLDELETGSFFKVHADLFAPIENGRRREALVLSLTFLDDTKSQQTADLEVLAMTALTQRRILGRTLDSEVDLYVMADRDTHPELFSSAALKRTVVIDYMDMDFEEAERFCIQKISEQKKEITELTRTIVSCIENGLGDQDLNALLAQIAQHVHVHAKLPEVMTQSGFSGKHSSFAHMVSALPERDQITTNSVLLTLASYPFVLSDELYKALGIQESKKNPLGTDLMKRAKLSVAEAFAVLSNSAQRDLFAPLLETTPADFVSASAKIGASSFAKDVKNEAVIKQFESGKDCGI